MASIDRTICSHVQRTYTPKELIEAYTPTEEERRIVDTMTRTAEHQLNLMPGSNCFRVWAIFPPWARFSLPLWSMFEMHSPFPKTWYYAIGCIFGELSRQLFLAASQEYTQWKQIANTGRKRKNKESRNYRGQCDYFAVYNETLNKVSLVPVDQVGTTSGALRLTTRKNNQEKNTLWARDYEL